VGLDLELEAKPVKPDAILQAAADSDTLQEKILRATNTRQIQNLKQEADRIKDEQALQMLLIRERELYSSRKEADPLDIYRGNMQGKHYKLPLYHFNVCLKGLIELIEKRYTEVRMPAEGLVPITMFAREVDEARDQAPNYYQFIAPKDHFNLERIKKNCTNKHYASLDQFLADLDMIRQNSQRYNGPADNARPNTPGYVTKSAAVLVEEGRSLIERLRHEANNIIVELEGLAAAQQREL